MNKRIVAATVIGLLITGAVIAYVSLQPAPNPKVTREITTEATLEESKSRYVHYSPAVFSSGATGRRVLFFYASWCPVCRPADASFKDNSERIPNDVTLIRVNYNDPDTEPAEKELAKKYGVLYQHTFVQIDSKGEAVHTWNGGEIDELLTQLK